MPLLRVCSEWRTEPCPDRFAGCRGMIEGSCFGLPGSADKEPLLPIWAICLKCLSGSTAAVLFAAGRLL